MEHEDAKHGGIMYRCIGSRGQASSAQHTHSLSLSFSYILTQTEPAMNSSKFRKTCLGAKLICHALDSLPYLGSCPTTTATSVPAPPSWGCSPFENQMVIPSLRSARFTFSLCSPVESLRFSEVDHRASMGQNSHLGMCVLHSHW